MLDLCDYQMVPMHCFGKMSFLMGEESDKCHEPVVKLRVDYPTLCQLRADYDRTSDGVG